MASKELTEFERLFGKLTPKQQKEFEESIKQQKPSTKKRGSKIMQGYKAGGKV